MTQFSLKTWIFLAAATLAFSACTEKAADIRVEDTRAMLSPMMVGAGSVFMKIVNSGKGGDALLSARASIPGTVTELHDVKKGRMVKTDFIRIPSESTAVLQPGHLHIMIFKMPPSVKAGSKCDLVLTFQRSGEKTVNVEFTNAATNRRPGH